VDFVLRPLRKREILVQGAALALGSLPRLFLIQLLFLGPVEPLLAWLQGWAELDPWLAVPLEVLGILIQVVAGFAAVGMSLKVIADQYLRRRPTVEQQLRFAAHRLGPLTWTSLVYTLRLGVAFLCLIVPGVVRFLRWFFMQQVVVLEGLRGRAALRRSAEIWRSGRGKVVALILLAALLKGLVDLVAETLAATLGYERLWRLVGTGLAGSLQAGVFTITYFDLRMRQRGFGWHTLQREIDQVSGSSVE